MTLLIAAIVTVATFVLGHAAVDSAQAAEREARAQAAADAAALAAIAESAPGGRGAHARMAEFFAERNGAELIECDCVAGAYRVTVKVEFDDVEARATAELDPSLLTRAWTASVEGMHPALAAAIDELIAASGGRVYLVSGFRTSTRQAQLWSQALARYGSAEVADDWVARPGHSMHEQGLAADLGGDVSYAARLVVELELPLHRPLANEPWHFELIGSRG